MLLPNGLNGLHIGVTNHLVTGMIFQVRLAGARVGPGRGSRTFCTAEFVEAEEKPIHRVSNGSKVGIDPPHEN